MGFWLGLNMWMALQIKKDFPVLYVNTGVDFPETVEFKTRIHRKWDLNLYEVKPETNFFKVMDRAKAKSGGIDDGSKASNICCYWLKEKPVLKFHREYGFTHCFTGITALESRKRAWTACQKGMEYYAKKNEIWKVHPIIYWSPSEVHAFIRTYEIPVNPIYEKYDLQRSGCVPCTCYRGWREQLARVNPKLYKIVMERYFNQQILSVL
jgi:3'-phosphoadenosine 5'-phosphosulfate sulfotransferase (PAPS reductase)/FAD synthetase